ncbi:MAG: hypothetical protein P8R42_22945 [Candidatus Binatia bacterium]|nr:hypothetical protein [Candidatus Binatia bacterium]
MPLGFLCWVAWLAGTSWTGMMLMQAGVFSGPGALVGGLLAAVITAILVPPGAAATGAMRWIAVLALLLCTTLLPAIDTTLFSQDASVHVAAGRWLARHGTLAISDPALESITPEERLALFSGGSTTDKRISLVRVPGGVVIPDFDETVAYPSFSHLLSVWVAIAVSVLGPHGPSWLGSLFAFSAWWAIGLIAWRDGGGWGAAAVLGLLATWLPEHWFGRFLMPEMLAQALVWSGVAASRFAMDGAGLDSVGRVSEGAVSAASRRAGWVAGAIAGLSLGVAAFARLEQFWVFIPALLLVRVFVHPGRWVLPPGALAPLVLTSVQGVFHLWWIPTDYGNRIYKSAQAVYLKFVLVMLRLSRGDGYVLGFVLEWVVPAGVLVGVGVLLWWGRRLARKTPGSLLRPLLAVVTFVWLVELYSRGLPSAFPGLDSLVWYIPWPVWGAVFFGLPGLLGVPALELAVILEAIDQVVWGRVSPEHIWASRRLVTVGLPVLALIAVRGAFRAEWGGTVGAYAARSFVVVAILLGALGLRPVLGVPFQAGGYEFVADLAEDIPPSSTVVFVKPLDWLQIGSALWLGHGRHSLVMREEGYPGYDAALEKLLASRGEAPVFVVAGAVVGPQGGDDEAAAELARLPEGLRLERLSSYVWHAPTLEVTYDRPPEKKVNRRAFLHLYKGHWEPGPGPAGP